MLSYVTDHVSKTTLQNMNDKSTSQQTTLVRKLDRNARRAFTIMLAVAVLTPPVLVFLGFILWPIMFLVQPITKGAYPFCFAGHYSTAVEREPIRSFDWLASLPITIVQWILLSMLFAWIVRRFPWAIQIVSALVFYFFISWLGSWIANELGIELVVDRIRM